MPVTVGSIDHSDVQWRAMTVRGPRGELTTVAIDLSDVQSTVRALIYAQLGIGAAVLLVLGVVGLLPSCIAACGRWSRWSRPPRRSPPGNSTVAYPNVTRVPRSADLSLALNGMLAQIQRAVASSESSAEAGPHAPRTGCAGSSPTPATSCGPR